MLRHSFTKAVSVLVLALFCVTQADAAWVKQNSGTFAWLRDIKFFRNGTGWIVGGDGFMLSSRDGGDTWTQERKFTNDMFRQIHFTDENVGWLLCERGQFARGNEPVSYIRKTTDGGKTWEKLEFADAGRERVLRLVFAPNGKAKAFGEGGIFYELQEDGKTWKRTQTAIHYLLNAGAYADENVGAIVGAGSTIMFTEDGGFTWTKASLLGNTDTRFQSVYFQGRKGAWAVGTNGRIFYSNGGARLWREQPSGTKVTLNDIQFMDDNRGWIAGDNGIIIKTVDGGQTWVEDRTSVTHKIEKLAFFGGRGWAIGFGGTVLNYVDGREPSDAGSKPVIQRRN